MIGLVAKCGGLGVYHGSSEVATSRAGAYRPMYRLPIEPSVRSCQNKTWRN